MIFLTGDVHGDLSRFKQAKKAHIKKKDTLIICGDFGFIWDGNKAESKKLKFIGKRRYKTLFVDGYNENHRLLNSYPCVDFMGGKARRISGNLYSLMRGEVYNIDEKKVFAFGGGDGGYNCPIKEDEELVLPSCDEMQNASDNLAKNGDSVDIIVTHDAPKRVKSFIDFDNNELTHLNTFLEDICQTVKFKQWYIGKYHTNHVIPPCYNILFTSIVPYKGE